MRHPLNVFMRLTIAALVPSAVLVSAAVADTKQSDEARARMGVTQAAAISADSAEELRHMLGDTVEAALDGDYEDFVDNLTEKDRERIGRYSEADLAVARKQEGVFSKSYTERFGDEIDWDDNEELDAVFQYPIRRVTGDEKRVTVEIPAVDGGSPKTLSLVNEGTVMDSWVIDAPTNISGPELRSRLDQALQKINVDGAKLPNDRAKAAGYAANIILSTVASPKS